MTIMKGESAMSFPGLESDDETVLIGMADLGLRGFVMSNVQGNDLVVRTARESGWWSFERPLPAVFWHCSKRWPGLMLDIGANTGFYSFLHLSASDQNRVVAFEPDPRVLSILQKNVALNVALPRMTVHPVALSDQTGTTTLFVPLQGHGLVESSSSLEAGFKEEHSETIQVPVSRLDDFLPTSETVSLVKIDVEGHEKHAVSGAEDMLARCRPIVAIELLEADYIYFNMIKTKLGYRSVSLRENQAVEEAEIAFDPQGWNHVLVPEEKWEDFSNILRSLGL